MDSNYSLSDIAAVAGENGGFGGGSGSWLIILLFIVLFGGGNFGGSRGNAATSEDLAAGFNFNSLGRKGNDILAAINSEGRATDNAICQLGYQTLDQTSKLAAQFAQCCCETQAAIHAEGEQTRAMFRENEIQNLRDQVSALQLSSALCGVPRINTDAYGIHAYPQCGCNY